MRFFWLAMTAITFGCAPAQAPAPEIDLEAERSALLAADRAWYEAYAASETPAQAFVDQMLDDCHLLAPDAPLARGKDAIRGLIESLEALPRFSVRWAPSLAEVSAEAHLGYTIGAYEMEMEGADGKLLKIGGKYLTVWRKQADGSWKVTADMFNADAPPAVVE